MNAPVKEKKKPKKIFIEGAISSEFIANSITKHQTKTNIGAHNIFLGQVRNDIIEEKEVAAIEYSAYTEMAEKEIHRIREEAFEKFDLVCLHIYHSLNVVKVGEVCLFIFVSSAHRDASYQASRFIVEEVKAKAPIFGKEIFKDESYTWKVNN